MIRGFVEIIIERITHAIVEFVAHIGIKAVVLIEPEPLSSNFNGREELCAEEILIEAHPLT